MLNRVILIGRLTHDPELRYTQNSGIAITRFSLAVNRKFTNQNGEREADFINIVTWRGLAENCANYLRKGSLVAIEGRIQTGKYENNEGRTVYTTDVVADDVRFLEPRNRDAGSGQQSQKAKQQFSRPNDPFAGEGISIDIDADDIPF